MGGSSSRIAFGKGSPAVRIVHAGGRVEEYYRPVSAAEIMSRHPRHYVATPDVFRCPTAVIAPEVVLMPGEKFFLVPFHTVSRLLRRHGCTSSSATSTTPCILSCTGPDDGPAPNVSPKGKKVAVAMTGHGTLKYGSPARLHSSPVRTFKKSSPKTLHRRHTGQKSKLGNALQKDKIYRDKVREQLGKKMHREERQKLEQHAKPMDQVRKNYQLQDKGELDTTTRELHGRSKLAHHLRFDSSTTTTTSSSGPERLTLRKALALEPPISESTDDDLFRSDSTYTSAYCSLPRRPLTDYTLLGRQFLSRPPRTRRRAQAAFRPILATLNE